MLQPDVLQAKRVVTVQIALTLALAAAGFAISEALGTSALIGGGVCTVANGVFALWVFRRYRAQQPGLLVMRFYAAEVVKMVLILAGFAAAFAWIKGLKVPALLGAYLVVQVLPLLIGSMAGGAKDK
jgi:ATP synthase protein I